MEDLLFPEVSDWFFSKWFLKMMEKFPKIVVTTRLPTFVTFVNVPALTSEIFYSGDSTEGNKKENHSVVFPSKCECCQNQVSDLFHRIESSGTMAY